MAEGFHVDTDKGKNISYEKGLYYRGIIKGDSKSVAAFNFLMASVMVFFKREDGKYCCWKIKKDR